MSVEQAEAEYHKPKTLLESLEAITANAKANVNLNHAELSLTVSSGNGDTMDDLERNLRDARLAILASLHSTVHRFR